MIAKLPWILLALSVLFNFFFAGGFLQAESQRQAVATAQGAADEVIHRLGLSAQQQEAYLKLRQAVREQAQQAQRAVAEARQQFWAELAGRAPDGGQLAELQDFEAQQRLQNRLMIGRQLRQFLDLLTVEQRRQVAQWAYQRFQKTPAGRAWMDTIDTDKDGQISDAERAAARRAFFHKLQEFRSRLQQRSGQNPNSDSTAPAAGT